MLPLFIDTTGANLGNFKKRVEILTDMGYDISMIVVHVDKNTSIARVKKRNTEIERKVDLDFVAKAFDEINSTLPKYMSIIPNHFMIKNINLTEDDILKAYRKVVKFFTEPNKSDKGKKLIDFMKEKGYKYYNEVPEEWKLQNDYPILDSKNIKWFSNQ